MVTMKKDLIYADNAATTMLHEQVLSEMLPWLISEYGNPSQPYSLARLPKQAIENARKTIADCINACPEEVFFTSGGTESDNWVIKSIAGEGNRQEILTSVIEHHAILNSCKDQQACGVPVSYMPVNNEGVLMPSTLGGFVSEKTKLVSVMLANNEIGSIEPVDLLADVAHENGSLFHSDAVQAVGHIEIDVRKLNVDFLSASAHKFNGPKGIGFLFVRNGVSIDPLIHGGSQEYGLRAGTENIASIVGMAKALDINCHDMKTTSEKLKQLEATMIHVLDEEGIDYIRNGADNRLPGNVNISIRNASGEMLLHRLDLMGIMISTGSACDSKNTKISHVIEAIKVPPEYAEGTIRISFGRDNTEEEAVLIAKAISKIVRSSC